LKSPRENLFLKNGESFCEKKKLKTARSGRRPCRDLTVLEGTLRQVTPKWATTCRNVDMLLSRGLINQTPA
jgi:hypothetical protein